MKILFDKKNNSFFVFFFEFFKIFFIQFDRKIIPEKSKTMKNDRIQNTRQNLMFENYAWSGFGVSVFDEIKWIESRSFPLKKWIIYSFSVCFLRNSFLKCFLISLKNNLFLNSFKIDSKNFPFFCWNLKKSWWKNKRFYSMETNFTKNTFCGLSVAND